MKTYQKLALAGIAAIGAAAAVVYTLSGNNKMAQDDFSEITVIPPGLDIYKNAREPRPTVCPYPTHTS